MKKKTGSSDRATQAIDAAVDASIASATKWSGVTREDLEGALMVVMHGQDPVAARNLIEYFHEHVLDPNAPDIDVLLAYIRHAFGRIVEDGKSADVAFGLTPGRGEYEREPHAGRDVAATAYVILLTRNGWTWLDAKGEVANLLFADGKGEGAVDKAYRIYGEALQHAPDPYLLDLLPSGTVLIKRDMST
ncbi:MAG: hypothetical protein ACYCY9_04495 [Thiobacillus sp.]